MAIEMQEKVDSRRQTTNYVGQTTSIEFWYWVRGSASESAVRDHIHANIPADYEFCSLVDVGIDPEHVDESDPDNCVWLAKARYTMGDSTGVPGVNRRTFDTTGGTMHISHSRATIGSYAPAGKTAPDYKQGINVVDRNGQMDAEGVDVIVRQFAWTEEHKFTDESLPESAIYNLTGKVNSQPFRTYAAGEVLFMGATGEKSDAGIWSVTFAFVAAPNATNITTIPGITVTAKKGHHYLWVSYAQGDDAAAKRPTLTPLAAYVEQVYEEADINGLGI